MSGNKIRGFNEKPRLRTKVRPADTEGISTVLKSAGNFFTFEIEIAVELLDDFALNGRKSPYQFVFADIGKELAGFVCYGEIPLTEKRYDIYWIAVSKDVQNKGIGKVLLKDAEKRIMSRKGKYLFIETSSRPDYEDTHIFYERCGYHCAARIPDFYRDGDDKMIFMKKLTATS